MSIKEVISKQYSNIVDIAATVSSELPIAPEGWLCTVRKALQMSGVQLAKRLGVTRGMVNKTEKNELLGSVTIKTMQNFADAMECQFVYAIVPKKNIENIIQKQAHNKALSIVKTANVHMALEDQALSDSDIQAEVKRLTLQFMRERPRDLWDDN